MPLIGMSLETLLEIINQACILTTIVQLFDDSLISLDEVFP